MPGKKMRYRCSEDQHRNQKHVARIKKLEKDKEETISREK